MQSLCTLRDHCRQWPRNTRYQADATPYLGRTSTGWIAPACGWRTHSITSSARRRIERDMVAAAIVDHLRLCNWRMARGPPWGGLAYLGQGQSRADETRRHKVAAKRRPINCRGKQLPSGAGRGDLG